MSALFWWESVAGGGTEDVDVEVVSWVVGGIVRAEVLACVEAAAAGSGEVAEPWKFSVAV